MTTFPEAITPTTAPARLLSLADQARAIMGQAKSDNTRRAYRADWADFANWCAAAGLAPLPASAETVALYLTDQDNAGKSIATLTRRLSAISQAHQGAGEETPTGAPVVRVFMQGLRRQKGVKARQAAPLLSVDMQAIAATLPADTLKGKRDRALLLLGFAGAFRESELVGLDVSDMEACPEGLRVHLRRSKTDQEGEGRSIGIPRGNVPATCPVRAVLAWQAASGITAGKLFRGMNRHGRLISDSLSARAVDEIVKKAAGAACLDAAKYSGHSLRAGHATQAARAGASERAIMNQTGHTSERMVRRYIREANIFIENSATYLGL